MTKEELKALLADGAESTTTSAPSGRVDRSKEEWVDASCPESLFTELEIRVSANERPYFGADHSAFAEGDPVKYNFSLSEAVSARYNGKSPQQLLAMVRINTLKTQRLMNIQTGEVKNPNAFMISLNGSAAKSASTSQPI